MRARLTAGSPPDVPPSLLRDLRAVVGDARATTDEGARTDAGQDFWPITLVWVHEKEQPAWPAVVVRPRSADEVARVLALANAACIPVTPYAGRSGVCGGSLPVAGGISLDLQGLNRIGEISGQDCMVHVECGVYGPALEAAVQEQGFTVGHFPQSFEISTVGGWISCRGAGQYSNRYGKIEDMVRGLEVALADGTLLRCQPQPASATGPDLKQLFIGAEGTLGVITSAWLQLWPRPPHSGMAAFTFESFEDTLEVQRLVLQRDAAPAVLRSYDARDSELHFKKLGLEDGRCVLLAIAEGETAPVEHALAVLDEASRSRGSKARREDVLLVEHWLKNRNDVSGLEVAIKRGLVVDTIEVAAPWSKLSPVYAAVKAAIGQVKGTLAVAAHASHAYLSGACLYFTFAGAPGTELSEKTAYYMAAWDAAMAAVTTTGGTISHHHGIGLNRARFMAAELGAGLGILQRLKNVLDPQSILNPGKLGFPPAVWP
jgi:alkyldihydroxyacetonephosphate synthase